MTHGSSTDPNRNLTSTIEAATDGRSTLSKTADESRSSSVDGGQDSHFGPNREAPIFFAFLFVTTTGMLVFVLRGFLGDLLVAFILVGLVRKPYEWFLQRLPNNQWLASGITTLLVAMVIMVPLAALGYTIASEAIAFYGTSDILLRKGGTLVDRALAGAQDLGIAVSKEALLSRVEGFVRTLERVSVAAGGAVLSNIVGMTIHLLTVLVMVFYIRVDGERLRRFLYALSPLPDHEDALLEETFRRVARGVVVGQGLGSAIQGLLGGLSFWIAGVASPILWGSIMGVAAFLPLLGVTFVAIPAGIWLYLSGKPIMAISVIVFNVVQGTIIDNVAKTKLIGSSMRMHDLLVFLSMLGGIAAFGIMGLLYGPLIAMLFITLNDLYRKVYRARWGT